MIRGLVLNNARASLPNDIGVGVYISGGSTNNRIQGNFSAPPPTATARAQLLPRHRHFRSANIIGTDGDGTGDTAEGNLISGNRYVGVMLVNSNSNRVAGNRIGTNRDGTAAVPNGSTGVFVDGSSNNLIGTNGDGSPTNWGQPDLGKHLRRRVLILSESPSGSLTNRIAGNSIGQHRWGRRHRTGSGFR